MTKKEQARKERLMPLGIPRYVRVYDNGGPDVENGSVDRYTVVFSGNYNNLGRSRFSGRTSNIHYYLAMSGAPFHPQGFCQHGDVEYRCIDTIGKNGRGYVWPPAIGRKCHLGKRIRWEDLPKDCQKAAMEDYKDIWDIQE